MPETQPSLLSRALREAAVLAFFAALAAFATRPLAGHLGSATLRGPDPLIDLWTLHWLTGHVLEPARLAQGNVFAPHRHATLYSDLSAGTAVLLLPVRPWVRDPVTLYNLALLAALTFSGWAFHVLVRTLGGDRWAGLIAGTLAACGSHQLLHVYHLNLLSTGWLALLLAGLQRLLERPGVGSASLCACAYVLSALSSGYYAVGGACLALLFALWHGRRFTRRAWLGAAGAALLAALLLGPYIAGFRSLARDADLSRPPRLSQRMAFDPSRDLGSRAHVYRPLVGRGGEQLFPGLLAPALALLALLRRRPQSGYYSAAALLLLLLGLGPELRLGDTRLELPYAWLFAHAPLDSMRHPYTFAALAGLLLAVLAGLGWSALAERTRAGRAWPVLAAALLETWGPPLELRAVPPGLPPAYAHLERLPPGPVLELPVDVPEAMLWAARHGRPTANGIGAFAPRRTLQLQHLVAREWLAPRAPQVDGSRALGLLDELGVRYVVVPTHGRPMLARLAQALAGSAAFESLAVFPDGQQLFERRLAGSPGP